MSGLFAFSGVVHLLLIALLAIVPRGLLLHPGLRARLALGMLCGLASLVIASLVDTGMEGAISPLHPSLVASAAYMTGALPGLLAAVLALAGQWWLPTADWTGAALLALGSWASGLAWRLARGRGWAVSWGGVLGLALTLPLMLAAWLAVSTPASGTLLDALARDEPWRYALGVIVLCGGARLLRGQALSLSALGRREEELVSALRAPGGGRWEWDVPAQRLSYGGRLYRRFGLPDSPEDAGTLAQLALRSRACRRWSHERHHPEDLRRLAPYLRRVLDGQEPQVSAEYRMRDDQGRWRWLVSRGHAVERAPDGRVLRLSGMDLDVTEQRELHDSLRSAEAQYGTIYQTLPDAAGMVRLPDACILDVNPAFERLLGLPRTQIVGHTASELGLWAQKEERLRLRQALAEQGEVRSMPVTLGRSGGTVPGLLSVRRVRLDDGECMVFVFHDRTQEQLVREQLLASNSLLRQAGRMTRMGVWEDSPGGAGAHWSDVCYDLHGVPPGQPVPRDYVERFVAPEWRERVRALLLQCVHQRLPWRLELQIVRADGRRLWVRAHGEPVLEAGRVVRLRGVIQDIDAMRRATEGMRASEERLARLFQMLPTPMGFSRRSDGVYLDVNPAWEQLTGFSPERSVGQSSITLGICTPQERERMLQAAERGEGSAYEMEISIASGERRTVLQSLTPVDLLGEQCWLFTLMDITGRQQQEQRVREREGLLSLTIAAASLGLWDWDLEAGTITGDERWRAMLGLNAQVARAEPWTVVLSSEDTGAVAAELARHLDEPAQPFDVTCQPATPGAAPRWIRYLGTVVAWTDAGAPQRMVGTAIDVTSQRTQEQQLERMALYDALTGLPNRVLLERRLRAGMLAARTRGQRLGVGYLDLDGFKPINDRLGHAVGDRLLVQVAERLQAALRPGDSVARLGGDEFVILLPGLQGAHECERQLQALMQRIAAPYPLAGESAQVTASIGYTLFPDEGTEADADADADILLRHADQAMYAAKQAGRNRLHAFDAAQARARLERQAQGARLLQALQDGELALYLQPKVDMRLGRVVGAEALARWQHPQNGVLAPAHFLHLLDGHSELQALFGEWVVDTALALIAALISDGLPLPVSINITPEHLQRPGFAQWLLSRMALHPEVPAALLHLELTESAALYDIAHAARELAEVRAHGVGVSFDDFGTGYSSLSYLRRLPMDHLKLDRSFVAGMLHDAGDRAIVRGVIGLGRSFGCETVAEGVETVEQGSMLLRMGCRLAQGYCIARPMPAGQFGAWARGWQAPAQWLQAVPADDDLPGQRLAGP